ncbi:MAG: hypothetical protein QG597_3831, partial [Actinomycetota bacterium]|nr:hypothetical protein [Actinomycetota bacterium]
MTTDPAASQLLAVGPVCLRIRSHDPATIEFLARATRPAFRLVSTPHTPNVDDIRVLTHEALPDRLRTTLLPDATNAQPREPHQVIDGLHLVEKTAGTAPDNRHGYLLWTDDTPSSSHILLADDTPPSRTVLLRLLRGIAA